MKNLKTLLLIAVFTLGIGGAVNAQKVAHIDFQKLITEMPVYKSMTAEIEKLSKTYKNDIDEMAKTLEAKIKKYEAEQGTQTDITNKTRAQEVQQDRLRIQQYEQTAYQELQEKQNKQLNPIIEKAQKAIQEVATAKGFEYVLDATQGKTLLVAKGTDLYSAVKTKLGF